MITTAILLFACVALGSSVTTVTDCGPDDRYIKFNKIEISPSPIDITGKIKVNADVETDKIVGNQVKLNVNIRKSNLNGGFTWEVPCTNIGAIGGDTGITGYLGTCEYKGSCDFPLIASWISKGCPDFFKKYDIPCTCPFPAKRFTTDGEVEIDLAAFKDRLPKWLIEGGYEVEARMLDTTRNDRLVACLKLSVDVSAKKCPEVLKRLNACP